MIAKPWSQSFEVVAEKLQTDANRGLSTLEAERRLQQYGYNRLEAKEGIDPFKLFFHQFFDLMIGLLVVAAVISAWIGEWSDTILIALIVVANAVIGFVQECRSRPSFHSRPGIKTRKQTSIRPIPSMPYTPNNAAWPCSGVVTGWPNAFAANCWIREVIEKESN